MFMINAGATFIATFIAAGIYYLMKRRSLRVQWGNLKYGMWMLLARHAIFRLVKLKPDERTWKPNTLVLSGSPTSRWYLIEFAHAMSRGDSCLTLGIVVPPNAFTADRIEGTSASIREHLEKRDVQALVKIFPANDVLSGAEALIRGYGFGPITPNTIVTGRPNTKDEQIQFARLVQLSYQMGRNMIVVCESDQSMEPAENARIDVWWRGKSENVGLILTLVHLLKGDARWSKSPMNMKMIVDKPEEEAGAVESLSSFVARENLEAHVEVLLKTGTDVFDVIMKSSSDAGLIFMGMRPPADDEDPDAYAAYFSWLVSAAVDLPPAVLVMASENIEFQRIMGLKEP